MAFPTVSTPVKSPHLDEYDLPTIVDPASGQTVSLLGVVTPDANGNTTLPTAGGVCVPIPNSQVTSKRQSLQVGTSKIPVVGLVGVDPVTGAPVAFVPGSAKTVSGKFQSTVQTGTGGSQNIAHGLGVVPSLVLAAPYDNTASGSTPFTFQISEGVHDSTNLKITATSGLKYKVIAFA